MSALSYDCGKGCSVTVFKGNLLTPGTDFKKMFDTILVPIDVKMFPATEVAQKVHELCGDEIQKELRIVARNRYPGSVFVTGSGKYKDVFNGVMHMVIGGIPETCNPVDIFEKGLRNCFQIAHYTTPKVCTIGIPTYDMKGLKLEAFISTTILSFSFFVSMTDNPNVKNIIFLPKSTKEFDCIIEHF